ncbi:hypothetical protein ACNT2N_15870 [Pseudomonas thivervalensis]|uniref:hypothetical protein n=1 Tax=Pseudomonas thivervalensis TaxID=86265 RepID=UPI001C9B9E9B|nr:hypothetical protein [Pseudomonas thivervalensis]
MAVEQQAMAATLTFEGADGIQTFAGNRHQLRVQTQFLHLTGYVFGEFAFFRGSAVALVLHHAREKIQAVRLVNAVEQGAGIGVTGLGRHVHGRQNLQQVAAVHHGDTVGDLPDQVEVMGDEQVRGAVLTA